MLNLIIPQKISVLFTKKYFIIKGPLGLKKKKKSKYLYFYFDPYVRKLWFLNKNMKEKHFYLSILNKLIWGLVKGFSIKLNIVGVGYKAVVEKQVLSLKVGFNHYIFFKIPENISIKILNKKLLTLLIFGNDFQQVHQIAAEIRKLRPVEPYKGKGIKYFKEIVKKKEGKKTNV